MNIRPYRLGDAAALADIYVRAVRDIGNRHYSPAQISAWASVAPTPDEWHDMYTDGRNTFVAVDEAGSPQGFIDLEPDGHIDFFYCAPEVAGTGVAASLYDVLEDVAKRRKLSRLFVEASEAAKRFFEKRGFTLISKHGHNIGGVDIHNYEMEKIL